MGYELSLRRRAPDQVLPDAPALTEALQASGAVGAEGALTLPAGGAKIGAKLARLEGNLAGVDLDVPFGAPEVDFRAAVLLGTQLAARLQLVLVDPQLGGELTPNRAEDAVASWRRANSYAVDTAGTVEDVRAAMPIEPPPPLLGTRGKALLAGIAVLVAAYLLLTWIVGQLITAPNKPID